MSLTGLVDDEADLVSAVLDELSQGDELPVDARVVAGDDLRLAAVVSLDLEVEAGELSRVPDQAPQRNLRRPLIVGRVAILHLESLVYVCTLQAAWHDVSGDLNFLSLLKGKRFSPPK